jgi:hypothetical protein
VQGCGGCVAVHIDPGTRKHTLTGELLAARGRCRAEAEAENAEGGGGHASLSQEWGFPGHVGESRCFPTERTSSSSSSDRAEERKLSDAQAGVQWQCSPKQVFTRAALETVAARWSPPCSRGRTRVRRAQNVRITANVLRHQATWGKAFKCLRFVNHLNRGLRSSSAFRRRAQRTGAAHETRHHGDFPLPPLAPKTRVDVVVSQ